MNVSKNLKIKRTFRLPWCNKNILLLFTFIFCVCLSCPLQNVLVIILKGDCIAHYCHLLSVDSSCVTIKRRGGGGLVFVAMSSIPDVSAYCRPFFHTKKKNGWPLWTRGVPQLSRLLIHIKHAGKLLVHHNVSVSVTYAKCLAIVSLSLNYWSTPRL
jgi:hypothetical protein